MDHPAAIDPIPPASGAATAASMGDHAEIRQDLFCQECGYNLRGLTGDRCPECGYRLDAIRSTVSGIPWVHRAAIGRLRAYWRTVWLVMFQHKRFCQEMARPVSYPDAQTFRWMTLLHVVLPVFLASIIAYILAWPAPFNDRTWDEAFAAIWPALVLHGCFVLFLAAATGAPSYFFPVKDLPAAQQNSAIALSYYATAALAWTPLSFLIGLAAIAVLPHRRILGEALTALAISLPCAQVVAWSTDIMHIVARILPQRKWRAFIIGINVLTSWAALALGIFTLVPLVILYILVVFTSLR